MPVILPVLACLVTGCATRRVPISEITAARIAERSGLPAPPDSEAGTAHEQLARFRRDLVLAQEGLRLALGLSVARPTIEDRAPLPFMESPPPLESLTEKAIASRPDLRGIELVIAAATKRARGVCVCGAGAAKAHAKKETCGEN